MEIGHYLTSILRFFLIFGLTFRDIEKKRGRGQCATTSTLSPVQYRT